MQREAVRETSDKVAFIHSILLSVLTLLQSLKKPNWLISFIKIQIYEQNNYLLARLQFLVKIMCEKLVENENPKVI